MSEHYLTGYCRCLDAARTVCLVTQDGQSTEIDCSYPDCSYAPACKIAEQIREALASS